MELDKVVTCCTNLLKARSATSYWGAGVNSVILSCWESFFGIPPRQANAETVLSLLGLFLADSPVTFGIVHVPGPTRREKSILLPNRQQAQVINTRSFKVRNLT